MSRRDIVHALLERAGTTYAAEAKIEHGYRPRSWPPVSSDDLRARTGARPPRRAVR